MTVAARFALRAACLALAAAVPAVPTAAAPPAATPPIQQDRAAALAELVSGSHILLPIELHYARIGFDAGFDTDPEAKALVDENPGLREAIWAAVEPEFRRSSIEGHPALLASIAAVYRSRFTPAELEAVHSFFASTTGRKLVRAMYDGMDVGPIIAEAVGGADKISAGALRAAEDAGKKHAVATLGPEDDPALRALAEGVSMAKLQAVGAEVQKLTFDYVNEEDPAFDARVDAAINAAVEKYFAEQPAGN